MIENIVANKDLAEALSYWATTAGIVLAVTAGLLALFKHWIDQRSANWSAARELYGAYLNDGLEYPQYYGGSWSEQSKDPVWKNGYIFFVGKLLWACEEILANKGNVIEWHDSLKCDLSRHVDYLESSEFCRELDGYYPPVKRLVANVILEFGGTAKHAQG